MNSYILNILFLALTVGISSPYTILRTSMDQIRSKEDEITIIGSLSIEVRGMLHALPDILSAEEWKAIFIGELGLSTSWEEISKSSTKESFSLRFSEKLPNNPMLGRISDLYDDYAYSTDEVYSLLNECEALLKSSSRQDAIRGLEKIITACRKAITSGVGIALCSD
jgi:hypothetical protein